LKVILAKEKKVFSPQRKIDFFRKKKMCKLCKKLPTAQFSNQNVSLCQTLAHNPVARASTERLDFENSIF
jgi:hypothetical protein